MRNFRLALATLLAAGATSDGLGAQRPMGPERRYEGVYVTNFEIGFFVACNPPSGDCVD